MRKNSAMFFIFSWLRYDTGSAR